MTVLSKHDQLHQLLLGVFENQNALNSRVHPEWQIQGFPWYRAVWTEVGEAVQHLNWPWWKKGKYNVAISDEQYDDLHIELCDILHFGVSMDIVQAHKLKPTDPLQYIDHRCGMYQQFFNETRQTPVNLYNDLEFVATWAILHEDFNIEYFARSCAAAKLTLPKLLLLYYGKTALNHFRQDHGYNLPKTDPKAYIKMWQDGDGGLKEDNFFLSRIMRKVAKLNKEDDLIVSLASGELQSGIINLLTSEYAKQTEMVN